jgi:hypothetical protein
MRTGNTAAPKLLRDDSYIPLCFQYKFELAGMNTCRSVAVLVDVMFRYRVIKTVKNKLEQVHAIMFCVKLGNGAIDTCEKIQKAFGNDSLSRGQIFR